MRFVLLEILVVILRVSIAGNNCIVYTEASVSFNNKLLVSLMYLSA